jgi:threonine/homoserine/homoserine lactone efflux protein
VVLEIFASAGLGLLIALSLTVPPGPVNALIASHAVLRSWRAGFLVGMGAMTVDDYDITGWRHVCAINNWHYAPTR